MVIVWSDVSYTKPNMTISQYNDPIEYVLLKEKEKKNISHLKCVDANTNGKQPSEDAKNSKWQDHKSNILGHLQGNDKMNPTASSHPLAISDVFMILNATSTRSCRITRSRMISILV